jgi:hypothetical protein
MSRQVSALRGQQLGSNERRVLLEAAAQGAEDPAPLRPAGTHAWQQTSLRRSVASLRKKKLIVLSKRRMRVTPDTRQGEEVLASLRRKQHAVLRFARRSPLGEAVVVAYRPELETPGARIRWPQRLDEIRERVLATCPHRSPAPASGRRRRNG